MKTYKLMRNLLSIVFTCCACGIYLIMYMLHILNQVNAIYIPQREIRWVIEDKVENIVPMTVIPKIAESGISATEEEHESVLRVSFSEQESEPSTSSQVYAIPNNPTESLTMFHGVYDGPSGKETWYNLDMGNIIARMRTLGYNETEYPYDIREDGVKTLGEYVMVAADLNKYELGDLIETSLGMGIVCDTGDFADNGDTDIDIAVDWRG